MAYGGPTGQGELEAVILQDVQLHLGEGGEIFGTIRRLKTRPKVDSNFLSKMLLRADVQLLHLLLLIHSFCALWVAGRVVVPVTVKRCSAGFPLGVKIR